MSAVFGKFLEEIGKRAASGHPQIRVSLLHKSIEGFLYLIETPVGL
jgi:hypothetical protein